MDFNFQVADIIQQLEEDENDIWERIKWIADLEKLRPFHLEGLQECISITQSTRDLVHGRYYWTPVREIDCSIFQQKWNDEGEEEALEYLLKERQIFLLNKAWDNYLLDCDRRINYSN